MKRSRPRSRRGFSLIEATVSLLLVAGLLVSALHVAGAAALTRGRAEARSRGVALAEELLSEALGVAYDDPQDGPVAGPSTGWSGPGWGPEPGEASGPGRAGFDDADDYDGWVGGPPRGRDGTPIEGAGDYRRTAVVRHVDDADPSREVAHDEGLKRVVVSVSFRGRPVAEAVGLASRAGGAR